MTRQKRLVLALTLAIPLTFAGVGLATASSDAPGATVGNPSTPTFVSTSTLSTSAVATSPCGICENDCSVPGNCYGAGCDDCTSACPGVAAGNCVRGADCPAGNVCAGNGTVANRGRCGGWSAGCASAASQAGNVGNYGSSCPQRARGALVESGPCGSCDLTLTEEWLRPSAQAA